MGVRCVAYGVVRMFAVIVVCVSVTACATSGPPPVGSGAWHEQRTAEIQQAYDFGEITKEQYLALRNEADQIHMEYRDRTRHHHHSGIIIGGPFIRHRF